MSPRELSNRRNREVQEALSGYTPQVPGTDVDQLRRLCRAVLTSIDVRDLREVSTDYFIESIELVYSTIRVRESGGINAVVRVDGNDVVVESCLGDQPFLVSALQALMLQERLEVRSVLNAVIRLRRDRQGRLVGFDAGSAESIVRMELRAGEGGVPADLQAKVEARLQLAQRMVRDFQTMLRRTETVADDYSAAAAVAHGEQSVKLRETEGLLRWLCRENFVLFSVEEFDLEGERANSLGTAAVSRPHRDLTLLQRAAGDSERFVRYQRSGQESPVHRSGKPGHFVFSRVNRKGEAVGVFVIEGLFTYRALHTPPEEIPHLRILLRDMIVDREVGVDSHRGKNITNAFNSLPLEYLLTESRDEVWELTDRILRAEEEGGTAVTIKVAEDRRFGFVFVALPRAQFSEELRLEVQDVLLEAFGASYADYGVYVDRYDNAIIHYYITAEGALPRVELTDIQSKIHELARSWNERLREAIDEFAPSEEADQLFSIYQHAFNEEHRRRAAGERLVGDLHCLEALRQGSDLECDLFVSRTGDHPGSMNLRVFTTHSLTLSDQLPIISSFGFGVVDEYSRQVRIAKLPGITMHNFRLDVRRGQHRQLLARREEVIDNLRHVFSGQMGRDRLNRLVASTHLNGRDVEILRAYVAYLHQLRSDFATRLIRRVLVDHPTVTASLIGLLNARFDPADDGRNLSPEKADAVLESELRVVQEYTADRVLRQVAEVVRATVRVNAFVARSDRGEAFAFKIAGSELSLGPAPRPYREIWVYHQEFEGVHLRGGKVARGGLRFSDRPDDFRTEIHGLMATQMVKNVLIVPMGAKGGFVIRKPPLTRKALREAGDHFYQRFIRALLSVTDNVVDGETVTPDGIRHTEGPDPYLVVAADKGTAHLSDTANGISMEKSFWMDDAFASGGSNGYDHKATGITARGAWETTKRCFREMGIDPESDEITAIGVGDMSGDVFGNGLLRSKTVKLRGAFNHIHIFVDPDPDPATSFVERQRVFDMPRSTWEDYSSELISEGGGVYSRQAKSVALSARAREMLSLSPDEEVSGEEVIRAMMKLRVDLFWMGGIGTYVKSRDESHAEVGDKANDNVRINANELGCRVFAEGANLAITDRGRADFARSGGSGYTAFLDNSGGVDTSDHEVNIKILFAPLLAAGTRTREARNEVLERVEDEVCEMVLDNNRAQSRMVSFDSSRSGVDLWRYQRTQAYLAATVPFDPEAFSLPREEELQNRARKGKGMHKCELAVLGSHAKMRAYSELLAAPPLPENLERRMVREYFPEAVLEAAGDAVESHLLRREIATTMLVNRILDNAGSSFFAELHSVSGRRYRDIALAYMQSSELSGAEAMMSELYALENKHNQAAIYKAMGVLQGALEEATYYLLGPVADAVPDELLEEGKGLLSGIEEALPGDLRATLLRRSQRLVDGGIPDELARRVVAVQQLPLVLDVLRLSDELGRPLREVLEVRLQVVDAMKLPLLQSAITRMELKTPWDGPAVLSLSRQLELHAHKMCRMVKGDAVEEMIQTTGLSAVRESILDFLAGEHAIAGLVVLDSQLRRMLPPALVSGPN
jgi:glutamate dehydrogenase